MLKTILSISGRPGLFKMVSNNKNMVIVVALENNKKMPVHSRDRIVSLGDISIYTEEDEILLKEVLCAMKEKENGAEAAISANARADDLRKYFEEIIPKYDKERVHPSDIKKIINWYNLLVKGGIEFDVVEEEEKKENKSTEEKE